MPLRFTVPSLTPFSRGFKSTHVNIKTDWFLSGQLERLVRESFWPWSGVFCFVWCGSGENYRRCWYCLRTGTCCTQTHTSYLKPSAHCITTLTVFVLVFLVWTKRQTLELKGEACETTVREWMLFYSLVYMLFEFEIMRVDDQLTGEWGTSLRRRQ